MSDARKTLLLSDNEIDILLEALRYDYAWGEDDKRELADYLNAMRRDGR